MIIKMIVRMKMMVMMIVMIMIRTLSLILKMIITKLITKTTTITTAVMMTKPMNIMTLILIKTIVINHQRHHYHLHTTTTTTNNAAVAVATASVSGSTHDGIEASGKAGHSLRPFPQEVFQRSRASMSCEQYVNVGQQLVKLIVLCRTAVGQADRPMSDSGWSS